MINIYLFIEILSKNNTLFSFLFSIFFFCN